MDDGTTEEMLHHLDWKRRQLNGEPQDPLNTYRSDQHQFAFTATVILLSLCKNITTLYLGEMGKQGVLQEYLLESNYSTIPYPGLQRLQNVVLLTGGDYLMNDERYYDIVEILDPFQYFHRLPAIQSVTMEGIGEYQGERNLFVPKTSNLKSIHIGHCDIPSSLLGTVIRIPKALEELSISMGGLWNIDGGRPMVYSKTIGKCLLEHKETLRVLDLDVDFAGMSDGEDGKDNGGEEEEEECRMDQYFNMDLEISDSPLWSIDLPDTRQYGRTIGSLHDFMALTHLSIGVDALIGPHPPFRLIDALPANLEYFCLYGYVRGRNQGVDEHVAEFMQMKSERLPKLVEVKGIDETEEGLGMKFRDIEHMSEEELWKKPTMKFDWIEAL